MSKLSRVVVPLVISLGVLLLVAPNVWLAYRLITKPAQPVVAIHDAPHDVPLDVPAAYPMAVTVPVAPTTPPADSKPERLPAVEPLPAQPLPVEPPIRLPTRMVDQVAPGAVTAHLDPTAAAIPREQMQEITTNQLHDILKRSNELFVKQFKQPPPPLSEQIVALQAEGVLVPEGSGYLIYRPVYNHFTRIDIGRDATMTSEQRTIAQMVDKQLATAVRGMSLLDAWPAVISPCDSNGSCFRIPGAHLTIPDPVLKQRALDAQTTSVIVWGKKIGIAADGSPLFTVHRLERHDTEIKD